MEQPKTLQQALKQIKWYEEEVSRLRFKLAERNEVIDQLRKSSSSDYIEPVDPETYSDNED